MSSSNVCNRADGDAGTTRVRVWSRRRFDPADFDPDRDKFKDAIVLPREIAKRLFPDGAATGYVRVSEPDGDRAATLYALSFSEAHESVSDSAPDAYLRRNVRARIDRLPIEEGAVLELEATEQRDSGPLTVVRFSTHTESTRAEECRVAPSVLEGMNVTDGDAVELYNPDTGGRLRSSVRVEPGMGDGEISLSTSSRKLLRVDIASRVTDGVSRTLHLRRPLETVTRADESRGRLDRLRRTSHEIADRVLDAAVGYQEVRLRVILGLNVDEGRATARVNRETMRILGIDDGDRIDILTDGETRTVQCYGIAPDSHLIETDEDFESTDVQDRVILLPATEREAAGVLCDDVVRVRRNPFHVAVRRVVPSLLGFLGVFISGLQTISLTVPPKWYRPAIGVAILASFAAVWLILWPERQQCR